VDVMTQVIECGSAFVATGMQGRSDTGPRPATSRWKPDLAACAGRISMWLVKERGYPDLLQLLTVLQDPDMVSRHVPCRTTQIGEARAQPINRSGGRLDRAVPPAPALLLPPVLEPARSSPVIGCDPGTTDRCAAQVTIR
jgi:hypothetical protein